MRYGADLSTIPPFPGKAYTPNSGPAHFHIPISVDIGTPSSPHEYFLHLHAYSVILLNGMLIYDQPCFYIVAVSYVMTPGYGSSSVRAPLT